MRTPAGPIAIGCSCGCGSLRPTPARSPADSRRCGALLRPALPAEASPNPWKRSERRLPRTEKFGRAEAARRSALAAELGIPGVAERIAEEVEAEHREAD